MILVFLLEKRVDDVIVLISVFLFYDIHMRIVDCIENDSHEGIRFDIFETLWPTEVWNRGLESNGSPCLSSKKETFFLLYCL